MRKGEPRLTETNYVVGTPGYFAPEQMLGAEPDFTADLFAVGLVALYLLQGQKPDSRALVEHFANHGTPGAPQGIPEPLWQVLAGLLQPDPQVRFRTATGARKALTAAVEMLPEADAHDELVEVFDQIGPLPAGFGSTGPVTDPQAAQQEAQEPVQRSFPSSQTGSFHLAPPPQQPPVQPPYAAQQSAPYPMPLAAEPTPTPSPTPVPAHSAAPLHASAPEWPSQSQTAPTAPTAPARYEPASTRAYTAHGPQVPLPHAPIPQAASKRTGPPPKVAVPVLLVALLCFAVGIWALTQS
jgi:serine/threonine protein kinase